MPISKSLIQLGDPFHSHDTTDGRSRFSVPFILSQFRNLTFFYLVSDEIRKQNAESRQKLQEHYDREYGTGGKSNYIIF